MQQFTGRQYLEIDIANNFGLDKKTWQERLDWFEQHKLLEMMPQADEPAPLHAGATGQVRDPLLVRRPARRTAGPEHSVRLSSIFVRRPAADRGGTTAPAARSPASTA